MASSKREKELARMRADRQAAPIGGPQRRLLRRGGLVLGLLGKAPCQPDFLRVNAAPGYSEHHTGRAVDIGTPGCPPLEEAFEDTAAFAWLSRNAGAAGFRMTYPRGNPQGVIYEPWHWLFVG